MNLTMTMLKMKMKMNNEHLDVVFMKHEDAWICIKARGGMHNLYKQFKYEFPNEEISYHTYRKPSYGPNGGRSRINKTPRQRLFKIWFSDPANEAFFILKYFATQKMFMKECK